MRSKSLTTLLSIGLIMAVLVGFGPGQSAYAANSSLVSGISVQNLTSSTANIVIDFYDSNGTNVLSKGFQLGPNEQKSWYVPSAFPELPNPFVGSAVVSSDQPIAATVNTQAPYPGTGTGPSDPFREGTSSGINSASTGTTAYLTQIVKDYYGWNSHFAVQNAGGSTAHVTVKYIADSGSEVAAAGETAAIAPNASKLFQPKDNANLPAGFSGGVVVTSDQPIASIANLFNSDADASTSQFQSYNAFTSGATKVYVPRLVRKYYGYNSGLRVQNVATSGVAHVTISYVFPGVAPVNKSMTLNPGQALGVYLGDDNAATSGLPSGNTATGGAVITSDLPIVATANEDNRSTGFGITYNGIPDGAQTKSVFFPQVTSQYYSYCSGIQIQNVGSANATITATFTAAGQAPVTKTWTNVAPNSSVSAFAPDVLGRSTLNFNGAVAVTSDQNIVGIANMSVRNDVDPRYAIAGDTFMTYNGLNQ